MKLRAIMLAAVLAAGATTSTAAQEMTAEEQAYLAALEESLPGTLMNNPLFPDLRANGKSYTAKVVKDDAVAGGAAYRVRIKEAQRNAWDVSVTAPLTAGIEEGHAVSVAFWARAEKGDGVITVRLQKNSAPYTGVVENQVHVTGDWDIYEITGVSPLTLPAEDMALAFNFADRKQTVDIGLFYVTDLGAAGE